MSAPKPHSIILIMEKTSAKYAESKILVLHSKKREGGGPPSTLLTAEITVQTTWTAFLPPAQATRDSPRAQTHDQHAQRGQVLVAQ